MSLHQLVIKLRLFQLDNHAIFTVFLLWIFYSSLLYPIKA